MNLTYFSTVFLCCFLAVSSNRNVINILISFIINEDRPTSLLAPHLCWPTYELKSLVTALNSIGVNVAHSLQLNRTEQHLHHVVLLADISCTDTQLFLKHASQRGYFKSPYRWIIVNIAKNSSEINDSLNEIEILVDSDVVIVERANNETFTAVEVYKITASSEIIRSSRAVWRAATTSYHPHENNVVASASAKKGTYNDFEILDVRLSKILSSRRKNLKRHVLTMINVVTDSNDTRNHMGDRLYLHHDSISKMSYMVVNVCFEMLNATEMLIFTHTWGYKDKNGNWQGLIDHLLKKEGDLVNRLHSLRNGIYSLPQYMGYLTQKGFSVRNRSSRDWLVQLSKKTLRLYKIGTLTIFTQERLENIDYIAMVGSTAVRFVFREPPLAYVSNIFTLPFTGAVWLAILICILGCSLFLYITSKWESTMSSHPLQLDGSWADVLILVIGAVLQQGCTLEPRFTAGRCVTLMLFISLTILYAAYSANIVVLLRAPSPSVRSLQDLLNSPLKLGASDFEYNRYFFRKLNDPIRKSIYDKKIAPKGKKPHFYTMKEGVEKIRRGLFAFHMELNPGYRLIQETYQEDEKCDLVEIDFINEIDPWLPSQKRSPFKDLFRINLMKIRESGIQACIHQRLHVPRPRCMGTVTTFSSVGIADMYPALISTLYGVLLAPVVLLLEIMYRRVYLKRIRHLLVTKYKK